MGISDEEQIMSCKCELVRVLIIHGANLKFESHQNDKAAKKVGRWALRWLDLEGLRSYLITKNFEYA